MTARTNRIGRRAALGALRPVLRTHAATYAIGITLTVISAGVASLLPWFLRRALDAMRAGAPRETIWRIALVMLAVAVGGGALRYLMREMMNGVSRRIETDLRRIAFAALTRRSATWYGQWRTGDLMARLTNDLSAVRMACGPAVMYLVNTMAGGCFAIVMMASIDGRLTAAALVPLLAIPVMEVMLGRRIHERFEAVQEQFSSLTTRAQENLSGVRVVRAFRQERAELDRFDALSAAYAKGNVQLATLNGILNPGFGLLAGFAMAITIGYGGSLLIRGTLTVGAFVAFSIYLAMLTWPLIALGWTTNLFQRGLASMSRLAEVLDAPADVVLSEPSHPPVVLSEPRSGESKDLRAPAHPPVVLSEPRSGESKDPRAPAHPPIILSEPRDGESKDPPTSTAPRLAGATIPGPSLSFAHVWFHYPSTSDSPRWVLRDISFDLAPGQLLGIVGTTGAGKSALMDLIPRLFEPQRGELRLNGVPLAAWPLTALRAQIGYVPQDTLLFAETIGDNILYGASPDADDDADARARRLAWASSVSQLSQTIERMPSGVDTMLGERGITLSGGQKQRTAIARALARDPGLVLLDDSLSAVDTQTESAILGALRGALAGRTAIIVAHRVSAVRDAHEILVLDDGAIVERGTHDALIAHGGHYAALYRRQQLLDEIEETSEAADSAH